ncbi:hypothetical protein A2U01_0104444, partial [Trifolium medium]|nr:hypothetical protein [Trifolium medium]
SGELRGREGLLEVGGVEYTVTEAYRFLSIDDEDELNWAKELSVFLMHFLLSYATTII